MIRRLTTLSLLESAHEQIASLIRQHAEWLYVSADDVAHSVRRDELAIAISHERLMLSCWTEHGTRLWRVLGWHWTGLSLILQVSRKMNSEVALIELIPRASAKAVAAEIRAARQMRCERLAQLVAASQPETSIERFALSRGTRPGNPGRYAQILLKRRTERIAVTGPVVSSHPATVDAILSSALLWFRRTADRLKPPHVQQLRLVVSPEILKPMLYRVALLHSGLRGMIRVFTVDDDVTSLTELPCPDKEELWKKKLARFPPVSAATLTKQAQTIVAEVPHAIDVVNARHGETLRYFGLPFARVRSLLSRERVWFGINRSNRRLLEESTWSEWEKLLRDLSEHRSASVMRAA